MELAELQRCEKADPDEQQRGVDAGYGHLERELRDCAQGAVSKVAGMRRMHVGGFHGAEQEDHTAQRDGETADEFGGAYQGIALRRMKQRKTMAFRVIENNIALSEKVSAWSFTGRRMFSAGHTGRAPRWRKAEKLKAMAIQVRDTRQKKAIRSAFTAAARPLSPEEALTAAAKLVKGISQATIYRNINALVEEKWLSAVEIPGEPARYEVAGKGHHHHFQCEKCGKIYDLDGCTLPGMPDLPDGFRLTSHELFLYGFCSPCEKRRPTV